MPVFAAGNRPTGVINQEDENNPTIVKKRFKVKIDSEILKLSVNLKKIPKQTKYDDGTYTYTAELSEGTEYDINKSDSIISPYIGTVKYYIYWIANGETVGKQHILAKYAYQDGVWVFHSASRSYSEGKYNTDKDELLWISTIFK